jgi:hypothetical protein
MTPSVQQRRSAAPVGFTAPPMPNILKLAPKLTKAFPDDMAAIQSSLDEWWRQVESQIRQSVNHSGG